jgi:hypothetical protein
MKWKGKSLTLWAASWSYVTRRAAKFMRRNQWWFATAVAALFLVTDLWAVLRHGAVYFTAACVFV